MRAQILAGLMTAGTVAAAPAVIGHDASCDTPAGRLAAAAHAAGLPADKIPTAVAIGLAESAGDPLARGDVDLMDATWGPSVGAFQVRSLHAERGTGGVRDEAALTDLGHNARSMVAISSGGTNWRPWSVYTNGRYRDFVDDGEAVAGCVNVASVPAAPSAASRPDALELANRAATNVVYGVADRACPPTSTTDLCRRWRAFVGTQPVAPAVAPTAGFVDVEGMTVAAEAAPSLRRMLAAARLDGVELRAVSSLRTSDEQWALRVQNCPDPVHSPPGECSPPTARVGTSEHETGHAVDFADNAWAWLAVNAERFGWSPTAGIDVEPWHWAYTG